MSEPLIRTKFHPPRVSSRLIARQRLIARLHEQPERRLTLVVAPAGFGKTTIMTQWLVAMQAASEGMRVAWLSLDAEDSALERCWRYLVAAIRRVFPASCAESAALLEAQQPRPPRYFADVLANDLAALPGPLALVLDDYHQITSQDVHQALMRLVAHLPGHVHLVVSSRSSVPWALGRLRGQGQLVELRAADLCFTTAEVRELLHTALGAGPLDELATLLHARTEGWAVSLQLACLSLRAAPDALAQAQGLRGTSRHIADYLLDEVLARQPADLQNMLLVSALPERFCAELCAYLLEGETVAAVRATIAAIEHQSLLLVALDDEGTWYRYHQLVRDLLVFRLSEARGDAAVAALHRQCSAWFAARGLIEEAVRHALNAGDQALAAELVADSYSELLERDEGQLQLAPLLALLPDPSIYGPPRLLLACAFDCIIRVDFSAIPTMIARVMARLAQTDGELGNEESADLRGDIVLLKGIVRFWAGDFTRAAALIEEAYRRIPRARAHTHALAISIYGEIMFHRGDSDGAVAFVREHLRQVGAPTSTTAVSLLLITLGYINLLSGRLDQLKHDARLLIVDRPSGSRSYWCWGYYLVGRYHYERNELEAAEHCFQQASSFPYHSQERVHHDSLLGLAHVALARGALEQAADYARQVRAFAEERARPALLEVTASFEAALTLAQGDGVGAIWQLQEVDQAHYVGLFFWLEQASWRMAAVQISMATPTGLAEAVANLTRYVAEAEAAHNVYCQIREGSLLAMAHEARGEGAAALAALRKVVALAAPHGFLRSLVDCGPPLAALLRRLSPDDPNAAYIAWVLAAFPAPPPQAPPVGLEAPVRARASALAPALLTEREQEILALLAERLTDQEIAARLLISITTVRTHTRNIYGKLEVENRREAIRRARELGLPTAEPPRA